MHIIDIILKVLMCLIRISCWNIHIYFYKKTHHFFLRDLSHGVKILSFDFFLWRQTMLTWIICIIFSVNLSEKTSIIKKLMTLLLLLNPTDYHLWYTFSIFGFLAKFFNCRVRGTLFHNNQPKNSEKLKIFFLKFFAISGRFEHVLVLGLVLG